MGDITELFSLGSAEIIVTTLGKEGSICYQRTSQGVVKHRSGICRADEIADATGSGDAYIAGFLYGYLKGMEPAECCRLGSVLSWFVLQAEGCCTNMPTEEALLEKYRQLLKESGK